MAMSKQLEKRIRRTEAEIKRAKLEIRKLKLQMKTGKKQHKTLVSGVANAARNLNIGTSRPFSEGPRRR
jgi:hypothetical protein